MGREFAWSQGRRRWLPAGALVLACLLVANAALAGGSAAPPRAAPPQRPNVVVVMSDDQTLEQTRVMPHVLGEIGDRGATFDNFFVNFSQCCPSRATFLTGDYAHNHHVLGNVPPRGGFDRFEEFNGHNDLPLWMQENGYYTSQVGKYLNGYGDKHRPTFIPPGWNDFHAVSGSIKYYNYQLNDNGVLDQFGADPQDYVDRVLTTRATDVIDRRSRAAKPFFLYVAYKSPHVGGPHPSGQRCADGPEPAPRFAGAFADEPLPEPPGFNEADVSDKPASIQKLPLLDDQQIADIRTRYQCELASLQGVDHGVSKIVAALQRNGELHNTLLIYMSDNGLMHGEHRIDGGKVRLYEPSIHVPLLMRGPGIPAGVHVEDLAINADIAPTILDATGGTARRRIDGESLLPATADPHALSGRRLLIESKSYDAIRTNRFMYALHRSGDEELYDLAVDPGELQNLADVSEYAGVKAALASDLADLRHCSGSDCRQPPALKLRLHYTRGRVRRGDPSSARCAEQPVNAEVVGDDVPVLRLATFKLRHGTALPAGYPYEVTLPAGDMSTTHENRVRVTNDLADGRLQTLSGAFLRAC